MKDISTLADVMTYQKFSEAGHHISKAVTTYFDNEIRMCEKN